MVGKVVDASNDVSLEELQRFRNDPEVIDKVYDSPLQALFLALVDLMETDSQESMEMMAGLRTKSATTTKPGSHEIDSSPDQIGSIAIASYTSQVLAPEIPPPFMQHSDHPRYPTSYVTPTKKRNISETTDSTIPTRSTESTPKKMYHPETKVQSLQNKFMETLIQKVWKGTIAVPWVRGRKMFLTYSESSLIMAALMIEQVLPASNTHGSTLKSAFRVGLELSLMAR